MSLIASSAGCFSGPDFYLIFAPCGYDDPEILPTRKPRCVSKALTANRRAPGEGTMCVTSAQLAMQIEASRPCEPRFDNDVDRHLVVRRNPLFELCGVAGDIGLEYGQVLVAFAALGMVRRSQ
jgi:hypothetical protein